MGLLTWVISGRLCWKSSSRGIVLTAPYVVGSGINQLLKVILLRYHQALKISFNKLHIQFFFSFFLQVKRWLFRVIYSLFIQILEWFLFLLVGCLVSASHCFTNTLSFSSCSWGDYIFGMYPSWNAAFDGNWGTKWSNCFIYLLLVSIIYSFWCGTRIV